MTLVKYRDHPDIIIESTPLFITSFMILLKLANQVANSDKMLKMLQCMKRDWIYLARRPEIHILREYTEIGKQFTIAYIVGISLLLMPYMGQPLLPRIYNSMKHTNRTLSKKLPYPTDYFGNDVDAYYYYIYAYMCATSYFGMLGFSALDTMFIVQVQHVCGMFTVVGHQLQRVATEIPAKLMASRAYNNAQPKWDPAFQHLIVCIKKHNDAIEFSKALEASNTAYFLVLTIICLLAISIGGVQILLMIDMNPKDAVRLVVFLITTIVYAFFEHFFSQKLIDHSHGVAEYLCQAEWYKTSLATQKLFILFIMRAHVPCQLTAGKFMTMSMENFMSILKTSMSYFTVLRTLQ